jgi:hypothetical protein
MDFILHVIHNCACLYHFKIYRISSCVWRLSQYLLWLKFYTFICGFIYLFLVVLGWTQGLALARQLLYLFNHSANAFCDGVLEIGSYFMLRLAWTTTFLICALPCNWEERLVLAIKWLRWVSRNFSPGWLQTSVLLISASKVARVIGMGHYAWSLLLVLLSVQWSIFHSLNQWLPNILSMTLWLLYIYY